MKKLEEFKRCNSCVTAYISVINFLQVSVKASHILKAWVPCSCHFNFKHCHLVGSLDSTRVDRIHFIQYEQVDQGKYYFQGHFVKRMCEVAILASFIQLLQWPVAEAL